MITLAAKDPTPQDVPQSKVDERRGISSADVAAILSRFPRPLWTRLADALADMRFGRKQRIYPPLQVRRHGVALPEITLCKDARQIRLIGVMHLADKAVWEDLNALLRREVACGANIQFEAIRPVRRLNLEEIQASRRHRAVNRYLGLALGMQHQAEAVVVENDWVHADLTDIELGTITDVPLGKLPAGAGLAAAEIGRIPVVQSQRARRVLMLAIIATAHLIPHISNTADAILAARNRIAVRTALESVSPRIVSIWGAAHLPGMARLLIQAGWSVSDTGRWATIHWDRDSGDA